MGQFSQKTKQNDDPLKKAAFVKQETIKILKENTGSKFFDLSHSNFLLDTLPEARETTAKMNNWDFIKIKSFCTVKEIVNKNVYSFNSHEDALRQA